MKNLFFGLLVVGILQAAYAGDKGNGGDIVKCEENGLTVYRTLDSVVSKGQPFFKRMRYDSSQQAFNAILNHFGKTVPFMKEELNNFLDTFEKKVNMDRSTFWIKAKLQQLADENLYTVLPANCEAKPIQSVVLAKEVIKRYYYDPAQLSKIESVDDELSWMLVHEFLRDYIDNSDIIRIANAYIHSKDFLEDDEEEVKAQLENFGIEGRREGLTYSTYQEMVAKMRDILRTLDVTGHKLSELLNTNYSELSKKEKRKFKDELHRIVMYLDRAKWTALSVPNIQLLKELKEEILSKIELQSIDLQKIWAMWLTHNPY